MPLDPAVAALGGAALGAILSGAATWLAEHARWNRQLDVRWDETRLRLYVDFLEAMQAGKECLNSRAQGDWSSSNEESAARQTTDRRLAEIRLISSDQVYHAALDYAMALRDLVFSKLTEISSEEYAVRAQIWGQCHDDFFKAAREELLTHPSSQRSLRRRQRRPR
jgi:hypothetical protein